MRRCCYACVFWIITIGLLILCAVVIAAAAEPRKLTLPEAVHLALTHNHDLKIARLKVAQNQEKKAEARAGYFPGITNQSTVARTTAQENIGIPAGAFGVIPNVGFVPNHGILIDQGNQT